jgi:tetratricopeptide (TPR) repeat protein
VSGPALRLLALPIIVPMLLIAAPGGYAQDLSRVVRLEHLSADDVLAIAGRLIDAGRYDEAQALLDRLAQDSAGGTERDFLDGMIALARKDYVRAEAMFRRILAGDPALVRVRLELARTLFLMKKDDEADYHFRLAIAQGPDPAVIRNIARFRETIRARRAWRFNLTFGLAPDTNINSATDKERVEILGLPFELDPDARARSGVGVIVGADASLRVRRDREVPLYLAAYGRMVRYGDKRFNDIYAGGEAGPEFRLSGGRLRVAVTGLHRWYGGDDLVTSLGGRLAFDKVIGGTWGLEASLSARRNAYARRTDIDGWDIETNLFVNRALGASALGFVYAGVQRGIASDAGYSNWQARLGFGALKEIRSGLRPQLSFEVGRQINDAPLLLFGNTRRDWRLQASASIYKRDWNIAGFAPSLRVTWTRNLSSISLYDQKRLRTELGIAKAF